MKVLLHEAFIGALNLQVVIVFDVHVLQLCRGVIDRNRVGPLRYRSQLISNFLATFDEER